MTDHMEDHPTAKNMAALISYQDGAVVSRTLIKKKAGTLTLFAFDAGEGLSEHTSPYEAFVQVLDGEGDITIAGETYTVSEGEGIMLPADLPHGLHANQRFKMLLTMIRE